jgi:small nuclear ribonucleoprotein (snRNP)-like protein
MKHRSTLIASAVLALGGVAASADTLVLNNGREMRGKLVSVSNGMVVFDAENGRRQRVNLNRVDAINIGDDTTLGPDQDYVYDRDRDRYNDRNGDQTLSVYANRQWTDTGMQVRAGEILRFIPSGEVAWGPGRRDGPAGEVNSPYNQNRPIPDRPGAALIGRIGNDTFYIGEGSTSFRARTSGRLYLGVNDDQVQDNSGYFQVTVQRDTRY